MIRAGGIGQLGEESREVGMRLDAIGAGRFYQRVQAGTRGGAGSRLTEQPVLPTDAKRPDGVLDPVCVQRDLWVIEERQQLVPLPQHVENGLAQCTLRQDSVGHLVEPGLELSHDRRGLGLPDAEALLGGGSLDLALYAVAVVLSKVEQGRFDPTVLQAWLGETLTREDDRALFELLSPRNDKADLVEYHLRRPAA